MVSGRLTQPSSRLAAARKRVMVTDNKDQPLLGHIDALFKQEERLYHSVNSRMKIEAA